MLLMRSRVQKTLSLIVSFVIVLALAGYIYFQTRSLTEGPIIEVAEPINGSLIVDSTITIEGKAKNISWLSLNGKTTYTNEEGTFSKKHALLPGLNVITIEAGDKYGKRDKKDIWVFHKRIN